MGLTPPRTRAGFIKCRPLEAGSAIALVAPASPVDPAELEAGVAEIERLGHTAVYGDDIFERQGFLAGSAQPRARAVMAA